MRNRSPLPAPPEDVSGAEAALEELVLLLDIELRLKNDVPAFRRRLFQALQRAAKSGDPFASGPRSR